MAVPTTKPARSAMVRLSWRNSLVSTADGTANAPLNSRPNAISCTIGVASAAPRASENGPARSTQPRHSALLESMITVTAVGATRPMSPGQRTTACSRPRSLMLTSTVRATIATANTPKSSGASSRAMTIPVIRVVIRLRTLLPSFQASPTRTRRPSSPVVVVGRPARLGCVGHALAPDTGTSPDASANTRARCGHV